MLPRGLFSVEAVSCVGAQINTCAFLVNCHAMEVNPARLSSVIILGLKTAQDRRMHMYMYHDDVIKWKHFPCYWLFMRGIHRSPVYSPHKGQWRRSFDVFFHLHLNKRLSKQSRGWWFGKPSRSLWRHDEPHWSARNTATTPWHTTHPLHTMEISHASCGSFY